MTAADLPPPPAQVAPLVEVLGEDEAIRFLLEFGGAEIYWSTRPTEASKVVRSFGMLAAQALGHRAAVEGWPSRVPLAKPWIARVWVCQGLPVAEIARRLHVADTTVRGWTRVERDPRQTSIFDILDD